MSNWIDIDEFCKISSLKKDTVLRLVKEGKLSSKKENNKILIEASTSARALVDTNNNVVANSTVLDANFVEKTIGTILNLHEKVLDSKDETLEVLKDENAFLKEALYSMQELYEEDRKTIETLTTELKKANEEIEFLKRKYKLMWNRAVERLG